MDKSHHILMLVYGSVRDDPRVTNEGRSLIEAGYQITVVGAPREGYASESASTTINGMKVILIPLLTGLAVSDFASILRRLWSADIGEKTAVMPSKSSTLRTFFNILVFWLWVLRLGWAKRYDIIHSHDVIPLPVAWIIARRAAAAFIYDSHEPWQYVYQREGRLKNWIFSSIDRKFLPLADGVIISSEPLRKPIAAAGGKNITNVANYKRLDQYSVEESQVEEIIEELGLGQYKLVISYIGFLFPHRGVVELAKAAALDSEVAVLIAGRGDTVDEIESIAASHSNIYWLGWMRLNKVPIYTKASDVVYCWFPDEPAYQLSTPNKLFDAIATGRALIAHEGVGEMSQLIQQHAFGYLMEDNDITSLLRAFDKLKDANTLSTMQVHAVVLQNEFNWKTSEDRLFSLYDKLLFDA